MSQQKFDNQILVEPQAKSKFTVGVTPRANPLATGRVILIGSSEGGTPDEISWFTNKGQAEAVLRSGDSLRAMGYLFNPSQYHAGAPYVGYIRAQAATIATHDATSGTVDSKDYGTYVNGISVKIEAATVAAGSKITVVFQDKTETFDYLDLALSIQYEGALDSGLLEITAGNHIIGSAGTAASELVEFDFDFALSSYNTVSKVAAAIEALADWTCSMYENTYSGVGTLNSTILNTLAEGDVKSAALVLQGYPYISEYVLNNYSAFVDLTVVTDGAKLANTTGYEFLAAGAAPAMDTAEITAALVLAEEANAQIIWIDSETAADHALVTAHCAAHSYFREGYFGMASQTTAALAKSTTLAQAKLMNTPYGSLVACGIKEFAVDGSGVEEIAPKFFAAKVAGLAAGLPVQQPLTRKVFSCQGLQYDFIKQDREDFIRGGIICPRDMDGIGTVVNQGINTMQNNASLWDTASNASPEISLMRSAGDFNKGLAVAADRIFIGGTVGVGHATIVGFVEGYCKTKEKEGVIAENDSDPENILPAWENVVAERLGDGWSTKVSFRINNPFNFFLIESIAVL